MNKQLEPKPLTITQKQYFRIAFLSDIHFGETRAVFGSRYETREGQVILPNRTQKILFKHWQRICKLLDKHKVHCLALPGDLIGGLNYAESGRFMNPSRIPEQVDALVQFLLPICEDRRVLVWRGTQYHEYPRGVGEAHEEIVKSLCKEGVNAEYQDLHSYLELVGPKRTRRLFIAHEAPGYLVYPPNLASRDIQWALMSEARGTSLPVDAIFRAHLHTYFHLDYLGKHAVQLPCWLAHSPYKQTSRYFFRLQPTIGAVLLLVDKFGRLHVWGGSPPWSLTEQERISLHRETVKMRELDYKVIDKKALV